MCVSVLQGKGEAVSIVLLFSHSRHIARLRILYKMRDGLLLQLTLRPRIMVQRNNNNNTTKQHHQFRF